MSVDACGLAAVVNTLVLYGACLLATGSAIFAVVFRVPALWPLLRRLVVLGSVLGALATGMRPLLRTGMLLDEGLAGMIDPEMLALIWAGPTGVAAQIRLGGLLLLVGALAWGPGRGRAPTVAGVMLVLVSFTIAGHVAADAPWWLRLGLLVHLLGLAYWVGAFWPLHRAAGGACGQQQTAAIADRFGRLAVWLVPLLLLAGGLLAWMLVGSWQALAGTAYGRLLLLKVLAVTALLGLALMNKRVLVPAMYKGSSAAFARLRGVIRLEACVVALVLLLTALLTNTVELPVVPD